MACTTDKNRDEQSISQTKTSLQVLAFVCVSFVVLDNSGKFNFKLTDFNIFVSQSTSS